MHLQWLDWIALLANLSTIVINGLHLWERAKRFYHSHHQVAKTK